MATKRLFLGVPPVPGILKDLLAVQQALREGPELSHFSKACRWLPTIGMHLTLHFLGDVEEAKMEALAARVAQAAGRASAHVQPLRQLVFFPKPGHARVGGMGSFPAEETLQSVWEDLGGGLRELELPMEDRAFFPHITLVRFRYPLDLHFLPSSDIPVDYPVPSLALYESRLAKGGSRYEILEEFPLAR